MEVAVYFIILINYRMIVWIIATTKKQICTNATKSFTPDDFPEVRTEPDLQVIIEIVAQYRTY